jgi:hypothetical protein
VAPGAIEFPCLCSSQSLVLVFDSLEALTTCTSAAISNGWFAKMRVVDSVGAKFRVHSPKVLSGVGPLWGFRLLRGRLVRVAVEIERQPGLATLDEVKKLVRQSFRDWHGWESGGNLEELEQQLEAASTLQAVFDFVRVQTAA